MMAVFNVVVDALRSAYLRLRPSELHLFLLRISAYALPLGVALFVLISIPLYYVLLPSLRTNVVFPTVALPATGQLATGQLATGQLATEQPSVMLSVAFPRLIREISTKGSGGNAYVEVFASVFDTGGIPSVGSPNMLMLGVLQSVARDGGGDGGDVGGNVRVFLLGNTDSNSKRLDKGNLATLKKLRRSGIDVAIVPEASILGRYSEPRRGEVSQCLHDGVFVVVIRDDAGDGVAYVVHAKITPYTYGRSEEKTALGFQTGIQGGGNLQRGVEIYLGLC